MGEEHSRDSECGQRDLRAGRRMQQRLAEVGFVPGTQAAYLREFKRFEQKLDRKEPE